MSDKTDTDQKKSPSGMKKVVQPVKFWLSTGCAVIDIALAGRLPGGFPAGRFSQVFGEASTGKSILAQEPLGSAQRQGGQAFFADAEYTLDMQRASDLHGIDIDGNSWYYFCPMCIEDLFDLAIASLTKGLSKDERSVAKKQGILDFLPSKPLDGSDVPHAMAVDSLSALASRVEVSDSLDDQGLALSRPAVLSLAFRSRIWEINSKNLAVIFIDQIRKKPGVMFGDPDTTSGGEALKFYASVRVKTELVQGKRRFIEDEDGYAMGERFDFFVIKNKVAPPHAFGRFRVLYDYGIDDIGTSIEWLKPGTKFGRPTKKADPYRKIKEKYWNGQFFCLGDNKANGIENAIAMIEEEGLEAELDAAVEDVWNGIHPTPDRKPRNRDAKPN